MKNNALIGVISIVVLVFISFISNAFGECGAGCVYDRSASAFYDRGRDDLTFCDKTLSEAKNLIQTIISTKDKSLINKVDDLTEPFNNKLSFWGDTYGLKISLLGTAMDVYSELAITLARIELLKGNMYLKLDDKDEAKKTFRKIIIKFTGDAYKSVVKEAEFALEDLK